MAFDNEKEDKEYLEKLIPYISSHLDWREFLLYCDFLSYEEKKQFKELGNNKIISSEIVQKILNRFLQKSNVQNKCQKLQNIMKRMDNDKISNLLERKCLPHKSKNKMKMNRKTSVLWNQLRVEELIVFLKSKNVLKGADADVIRAKLAAEGNNAAAFELMFHLSGSETHWFGKFIEALIETGQSHLAEQTDSVMFEKILRDKSQKVFEDDEASCCSDRSSLYQLECSACLTNVEEEMHFETLRTNRRVNNMTFEDEKEDLGYLERIIPYISSHLDWREFLLHCDFLTYEEKKQFKEYGDNKVASSEIVQKIIDCLLQKSNVRNKREELGHIMKRMDNDKISDLIERKRLPSKSENKMKINRNMSVICSQLRVEEILVLLKSKNVLNEADANVIRAKLEAEGNNAAAFELMFHLTGRETHWFGQFMEALIETGQTQLAELIDNIMYEKIHRDETQKAFESDEASCCLELSLPYQFEPTDSLICDEDEREIVKHLFEMLLQILTFLPMFGAIRRLHNLVEINSLSPVPVVFLVAFYLAFFINICTIIMTQRRNQLIFKRINGKRNTCALNNDTNHDP